MLTLYDDNSNRLCDGISRREVMRVGGLSALGLSLASLRAADAARSNASATFGRAKNVIYLWLQGGPPQHETFDPKPEAPSGIRGEFKPISTNVPGIDVCELLPRTAAIADKLAIVRSIATDNNIHSASGYHVLTGYRYDGPNARMIRREDWPYFGSIVKMLRPSKSLPAYSAVWLPNVMRLNENVQPAGQTAGFAGRASEPERIIWDPSDPNSQIEKFKLQPDVTRVRLSSRERLLAQVDDHLLASDVDEVLESYDRQQRDAFSVLTTGRALAAFDIVKEPERIRARYGRTKWGQCVLLARRLIEAGVRLVHVNWTREPGDSAVDNPLWDTHALNADRLQDSLCPQFDVGFTALVEDLDQRGLLDETLVVAIGEFGRTPKINAKGGRDHWGHVFSFALAGAGIRTAQVFGESDKSGGYPKSDRVGPEDLTATLFHLLGIPHDSMFRDPAGRPFPVTQGTPIHRILGTEPATLARTKPQGDVSFVPVFSTNPLSNTAFEAPTPLHPAANSKRAKGWKAQPILRATEESGFGVRLVSDVADRSQKQTRHAALGIWNGNVADLEIPSGAQAILAQEIRNARSGHYTFSVRASGGGTTRSFFERVLLGRLTCRLLLFRFADQSKDPTKREELASIPFDPQWSAMPSERERFELEKLLDSPRPGTNFPIGNGLAVAVVVENDSSGPLKIPAAKGRQEAYVRINEVQLAFTARQINDDVKV